MKNGTILIVDSSFIIRLSQKVSKNLLGEKLKNEKPSYLDIVSRCLKNHNFKIIVPEMVMIESLGINKDGEEVINFSEKLTSKKHFVIRKKFFTEILNKKHPFISIERSNDPYISIITSKLTARSKITDKEGAKEERISIRGKHLGEKAMISLAQEERFANGKSIYFLSNDREAREEAAKHHTHDNHPIGVTTVGSLIGTLEKKGALESVGIINPDKKSTLFDKIMEQIYSDINKEKTKTVRHQAKTLHNLLNKKKPHKTKHDQETLEKKYNYSRENLTKNIKQRHKGGRNNNIDFDLY